MSHCPGTTIKPLVRVPEAPDAPCWDWLGGVDDAGYARKQWRGRSFTAARWMWEMLWGALPDALVVTTTCGSKTCCNPAHLRAVPFIEAQREGSRASLLPGDVAEIRRAKKNRSQFTATYLANRFNVSPASIRAVWRGQTWTRRKAAGKAAVHTRPKDPSCLANTQ